MNTLSLKTVNATEAVLRHKWVGRCPIAVGAAPLVLSPDIWSAHLEVSQEITSQSIGISN